MADILPFKRKRVRRVKHARETVLPKKRLVLRFSRRFVLALLLIVVSLFGWVYNSNRRTLIRLKTETEALELEVAELNRDIEDLVDHVKWLQTDTAIEAEARRRLNLVRPGERILKLLDEE